MKKQQTFSRWLLIPAIAILIVATLILRVTNAFFFDVETSNTSTATAWTSANWTQTLQSDFNAGILNSVNITESSGDVKLASSSAVLTNSPTTSSGTWTNPTNAYADGGSYGYITSGSPSGNETYGGYGFSFGTSAIYRVRARTDAWTLGTAGLTNTKNPAANTNGTLAWTNPASGYTSNDAYATVAPTYGAATSKNPTANTNGLLAWTNPANGYTSNNVYATAAPTYGATTSKNPTANTDGTTPWTNPANAYTSNNARATAVATIPTYRAIGTVLAGTTSAITPGLPSGMSANDIVILVGSTIAGGTITITANGSIAAWTAIPGTPIDVTNGEKLYVWWGRWSSGTTGPTLTPGSDHIIARTVSYYNCYAGGSPIDVSGTGTDAASDTSYSFVTGLTDTNNNELAITVCSTTRDSTATNTFSGWADASLASITERMDNTTANGGGGGFGMAQGTLITGGAVGTWSGTLSAASTKAYIAFSLMATVPDNTFDQVYGTFGITDPGLSSTITKVELGYEAYATATQQLDFYTSTDGGSNWNPVHTTANLATADPGAYTYIDVTADEAWTWTLLNDTNFGIQMVNHWVNGQPTWNVDALIIRVTYDDRRVRDQIYGTFAVTDPGTTSTITKVEVGYEAYASATGKLDIFTSNNNASSWSSVHTTADLGTSDPGAYTYIDVTSDFGWTWANLADPNLKVKVCTNWTSGTPAWSLDALVVRVTYDDRRDRDQIYSTFGIIGTTETITRVEVGYEAFATSTGKLDISTSNNGGSSWSAVHTTADLAATDNDSPSYIDVTSDFGWTWTGLNDTNLKVKVVTNYVSGAPAWSLDALIVRVTYNGLDNEQIRFRVTWDGGSTWSSYSTNATNSAESSYWYDFTSATSWTGSKLSDANFKVSVEAVTVGDTGDVRLDWIPVEVTYQQYAVSGTLASQVFDTTVNASGWDGLAWDKIVPAGTNLTLEVRASNTAFLSTDVSPSWTAVGDTSPVVSGLSAGRYKQWRATLTANGNRTSTPTLQEVRTYFYGG
jgi:hypothetical protein